MNRREVLRGGLLALVGLLGFRWKEEWATEEEPILRRWFEADETLRTVGTLLVYLDGEEVAGQCVAIYASVYPEVAVEGWCEMINDAWAYDENGELITEFRSGRVMWRPSSMPIWGGTTPTTGE